MLVQQPACYSFGGQIAEPCLSLRTFRTSGTSASLVSFDFGVHYIRAHLPALLGREEPLPC
jgi:hypothetical protein